MQVDSKHAEQCLSNRLHPTMPRGYRGICVDKCITLPNYNSAMLAQCCDYCPCQGTSLSSSQPHESNHLETNPFANTTYNKADSTCKLQPLEQPSVSQHMILHDLRCHNIPTQLTSSKSGNPVFRDSSTSLPTPFFADEAEKPECR